MIYMLENRDFPHILYMDGLQMSIPIGREFDTFLSVKNPPRINAGRKFDYVRSIIFFLHLPIRKAMTEMTMPMVQENIREPNRAMG